MNVRKRLFSRTFDEATVIAEEFKGLQAKVRDFVP